MPIQQVDSPAAKPAAAAPTAPEHLSLAKRLSPARFAGRHTALFFGPLMPITKRIKPARIAKIAAKIDPNDFSAGIAAMPEDRLAEMLRSDFRPVILVAIFRRMEEEFVASRAAEMDAVLHFKLTGRADGGCDVYEVTIRDRTCKLSESPQSEPKVTLELDAFDFVQMAAGIVKGFDLYIGGKLKFDGAMMLLTRLTAMFNIPDAPAANNGN